MIKETRQLFCDICGKEITCDDYSCRREVIEIDEDGYANSVGYDMCKDCTESFNDWKEERRADENSDQLFCKKGEDIIKVDDVLEGLRHCKKGNIETCYRCPYCGVFECNSKLKEDAASLIMQLKGESKNEV